MSYYGRGGNSYGTIRGKEIFDKNYIYLLFLIGTYGGNRNGGNNLLDDLDSFTVGPLRPGPAVLKNFYTESSLISNRSQV